MRIQADRHHQAARSQDAHGLHEKGDLVLKMVKGVDAEYPVERFTGPGQTFSRAPREKGSRRPVGLRVRQHLSRDVQARHANPTTADEPKPMAGAAANLEHALVGMLADEGNQRRLDTGVVVVLVSSVVGSGDAVVVYASSHGGSGVRPNVRALGRESRTIGSSRDATASASDRTWV